MPSPSSTFHRRPTPVAALLLLALLVACQGGEPPATNRAPVASFTVTTASGPAPLTVTFDASGSFDPDGSVVGYQWDFGTGASATGVSSSHGYAVAGGYTARLTVTDDRGATASSTMAIGVDAAVTTGRIAGAISAGAVPAPASGSAGAAVPQRVGGADGGPDAEVVPGEIIVKFRSDLALRGAAAMSVAGVRLDAVRRLALPGTQLYRAPGLGRAETAALARHMAARPDVVYAHPNYVLRASAVPNDEFYPFQWHYGAINLPQAWDITTGNAATVVAVGDDGILHMADDAAATHPDLAGKVLPGYDFVSNPQSGADGDGRDLDPYDTGPAHHGTHVAGTIAAATNNGAGVAGVDWQAKIVPARMLGADGSGSLIDVVEGTLWAAGLDVAGVAVNEHPAHVINLSLGGAYRCTPFEQEAFDRIAALSPRRAIVVVAAGNDSTLASDTSPAGCRNVITVGATEFRGHRAPYSNFGPRIDVMAPGGDSLADLNADGYVDGVLSLGASNAGYAYTFSQGTSMAAPHVAGVVSLMKALDPAIDLQDVLAFLKATARPLSAAACERPASSDCGAGLIDAAAALAALQEGAPVGSGGLTLRPDPFDFGTDLLTVDLTLANGGDVAVSWALDGYEPSAGNPGDMPTDAITADVLAGTVPAASSATVTLTLDRSLIAQEGAYQFTLYVLVEGVERTLTGRFRVGAATAADPSGSTIAAAFVFEGDDLVLSGFQMESTFFVAYDLEALAGDNTVIVWTDENENEELDAGDYIGMYPSEVAVGPGAFVGGVDVVVERVIDLDAWTTTLDPRVAERWWRTLESRRPTP